MLYKMGRPDKGTRRALIERSFSKCNLRILDEQLNLYACSTTKIKSRAPLTGLEIKINKDHAVEKANSIITNCCHKVDDICINDFFNNYALR